MSDASDVSLGGETTKATLAKFAMALSGFVGTVLFARILGPTSFGGFYLLFSVVKITDRPVGGWAIAAKKRFSEHGSSREEIFGSQALFTGTWAVIAIVFAILLADWLRDYTGLSNAPLLFALLMCTVPLYEPLDRLIQARGNVGVSTWLDTLRSYLTLPLQLWFVLIGLGAAGMVYGLVGATILTVPIAVYYIRIRPSLPSVETIRSLWSYARYSIPNNILGKAYDRFDVLLLGFLLTPSAAANYEIAAKLTLPAIFVGMTAASVLMPRVSNLKSKEESIADDITNTMAFSSILSLPIFFGALAIPRPLVSTIYGAEYADAAVLLVGIALYRVIKTQNQPLTQTINGLDMPSVNTRLSVIALAFNIAAGVVLTLRFGAIGVVVATIIAETIIYLGASHVVRRYVPDVTLFSRTLFEQVTAGIVMFLAVSGLHYLVPVRSWVELAVLLLTGVAVYTGLLLAISSQLRLTIGSILRGSRIERFVPKRILNW